MADWLTEVAVRLGDMILEQGEFRGEHTVVVKGESLLEALGVLKSSFDFNSLVDLCGVDMGEDESPRFYVVYHLRNMDTKDQLRVKVGLSDGASVPSCCELWKGADWMEREVYDMFGIRFDGHPNLTRLYLPEDFPGHPLRKDYPTEGYELER